MKPLSMRQWLILSWLLCLGLPHAIFNLVEGIQHLVAPALRGPTWIIGPLSATLLTAGLTLLGVIWLIGQSVLKPLAAMQQAAHQIAAGDIDVHLPHSRVREVNEVAAAFTAMGAGLRESVLRQAAIEQERRVLMSAVAHDLRTPLFALRGYLEGLEQGVATTPTKIARYLAVCREQVAVLDQRVQALFDYARLEYLEQPLQRETVDWIAMTQQIIERLRPAAALKQVDLRVRCPMVACAHDGDPQLLMRMLENLLDNAVRHTPPGGTIEISWRVENGRLYFSIADSGPGIAPTDLPHLFVPMYRGDASRNRATGGAGLGLTIAQRIAQAHGGTLHAANRAQGGAEFTGCVANAWVRTTTDAPSAREGQAVT